MDSCLEHLSLGAPAPLLQAIVEERDRIFLIVPCGVIKVDSCLEHLSLGSPAPLLQAIIEERGRFNRI